MVQNAKKPAGLIGDLLESPLFIFEDERVLLLKKVEGKFGGGKWNGLGGKREPGESSYDCAAREAFEESGLHVRSLVHHGALEFHPAGNPGGGWTVDVFSTRKYSGVLTQGDEGELRWFKIEEIPYREMWEDDREWLPLVLKGRKFSGVFRFDADWRTLLGHELRDEGKARIAR